MFRPVLFTIWLSANATEMIEMMGASNKGSRSLVRPSDIDYDEVSEEKRLQICVKGIERIPQLDIQFLKDKKTSVGKYWTVTTNPWGNEEKEVQSFIFMYSNIPEYIMYNPNSFLSYSNLRFWKYLSVLQYQKCSLICLL